MSETKEKLTELEWHRKMAAQLFNHTWDLLDKKDRNPDEDDEMIHSAHASRYHWGIVVSSGKYPKTGPMNLERGDWQISRVYSILKRPNAAEYHAKRCLQICEENNIGDFDIAFAYEALARAYAIVLDKETEFQKYITLAKEAGEKIKKDEDKKYFLSELESIHGYSI
ncbi:MAG: hypothetical protein JSW11_16470 [Candidatus Heimdallarchaeota archaeon]|nr:MAG: hypothetical protein JSW11_16470 [Candidatus Heimdallarchaeota archaeon]